MDEFKGFDGQIKLAFLFIVCAAVSVAIVMTAASAVIGAGILISRLFNLLPEVIQGIVFAVVIGLIFIVPLVLMIKKMLEEGWFLAFLISMSAILIPLFVLHYFCNTSPQ